MLILRAKLARQPKQCESRENHHRNRTERSRDHRNRGRHEQLRQPQQPQSNDRSRH